MNFVGVCTDLLPYVIGKNPARQAGFMLGSCIPIYAPEHLLKQRPDYVLIFPWNLKDEVMAEMGAVRVWGGRFVTTVPGLRVSD